MGVGAGVGAGVPVGSVTAGAGAADVGAVVGVPVGSAVGPGAAVSAGTGAGGASSAAGSMSRSCAAVGSDAVRSEAEVLESAGSFVERSAVADEVDATSRPGKTTPIEGISSGPPRISSTPSTPRGADVPPAASCAAPPSRHSAAAAAPVP